MTKQNNQIRKQLEENNNILLYQDELKNYYQKRDKSIKATYITSPKKGKTAYEQILKTLKKDTITKNMTISKIIEEIIKESKTNKIHIYIDNFEQLTKKELNNYKELEQEKNIILIVNIRNDEEFIDEDFLNKFIIINGENFQNNRSQSVNITFVILLLLSLLIFLIFLKLQLSQIHYLVSTLWFTLLMYRSFYYIMRWKDSWVK